MVLSLLAAGFGSDLEKQKTPPPGLAVGLMVQIVIKTRLPPCTAAGHW
jgi:hypothetical protein